MAFENIVGKEENAGYHIVGKGENAGNFFSFSHNVLYPIRERNHLFFQHLFCHLQMPSIWTSPKRCSFVKG